jgi:hypothetical protein
MCVLSLERRKSSEKEGEKRESNRKREVSLFFRCFFSCECSRSRGKDHMGQDIRHNKAPKPTQDYTGKSNMLFSTF